MPFAVCWSLDGVVDELAELAPPGPLPRRIVLVPTSRVAYELRRRLVERAMGELLAGTTFESPLGFARRVLTQSQQAFRLGEEQVRPARLRQLFASRLELQHFDRELFATTRGWDQALSRTINTLEAAALQPKHLRLAQDPRCADVALLWEKADAIADTSWTAARLIGAAGARLADPSSVPWLADTACVAIATGATDGVTARLMRRLPHGRIAFLAARPRRRSHLERVEELFGPEAAEALRSSRPPQAFDSDLAVAKSFLFEPPGKRGDDHRANESPPDSVALEDYSGVSEELDAAVAWVVEQVRRGRPLGRIAVLVPRLDPFVGMVHDRLQTLPTEDGGFPVHVAGGLSAESTASGARIRRLLDALERHLAADALAELLPVLQTDGDARRPSKAEAVELAYGLGTVGGSQADPKGALDWVPRMAARIASLEAELAAIEDGAAYEDVPGGADRARWDKERMLDRLRAMQPAVAALVAVAEAVVEGQSLRAIWEEVASFIDTWLVLPPKPNLLPALGERLERAGADPTVGTLRGDEVLPLISDTLASLRMPTGRFGEPAVYLGTVAGAVGLTFDAVRMVGLAEGAIPPHPQEDAVLPDGVRAELAPSVLPLTEDRALVQLHAFDLAVRHAAKQLTITAHRYTLERSYREPSVVFLEMATALGRDPSLAAFGMRELRQQELRPAKRAHDERRLGRPIHAATWLELAARQRRIPTSWLDVPLFDLDRIEALRAGAFGPMDGLLTPIEAERTLPGVNEARPISASRLRTLLTCPHQFLYDSVLGWREPPEPRPARELDPLAYGSLFHAVAEAFYNEHGKGFAQRRGQLVDYQSKARALARAQFDALLETYPLAGKAARNHQWDRLSSQLDDYLHAEWHQRPKRRFVATELGFGTDGGVEIGTPHGPLWGRGFIDLVEVENHTTLVRDLKTGQCTPRAGAESGPTPQVDVQLAFYAKAVQQRAAELGVPTSMGVAYVHINDKKGRERAFVDDYDALEADAEIWLGLARQLLERHAFPRTPRPDDCTYCPFKPVCGPKAYDRARELLDTSDDEPLELFGRIK